MERSYVLVFMLLLSLFTSCQKPEEEPVIIPDHCSNGLLDGDELNTDCGGSCNPCGTIAPPCAVPENKLYLMDSEVISCLPEDTVTISFRDTITFDGYYFIRFDFVNTTSGMTGSGDISLYGGRPVQTRAYTLESEHALNAQGRPLNGHAIVTMGYTLCGSVRTLSGKLYVEILPDNTLKITFCDVPLHASINYNYIEIFTKSKGCLRSL